MRASRADRDEARTGEPDAAPARAGRRPLLFLWLLASFLAAGIAPLVVAGVVPPALDPDQALRPLRAAAAAAADALAGLALVTAPGGSALAPERAGRVASALADGPGERAIVFAADGSVLADSARRSGLVIEALAPPSQPVPPDAPDRLLDRLAAVLFPSAGLAPWAPPRVVSAAYFPEVEAALAGAGEARLRAAPEGATGFAAAPISRPGHPVGAVLLVAPLPGLERELAATRRRAAAALALVAGLALGLAVVAQRAAAHPYRRLARAIDRVAGQRLRHAAMRVPGGTGRLGPAVLRLIDTHRRRMTAMERFAADVAHELKNPLTSLKSAVETAARLDDAAQQKQLMGIVVQDVQRLSRLIDDIGDMSRLDRELSETATTPVDLSAMLATLVEIEAGARGEGGTRLALDRPAEPLVVQGLEDRLAQVFANVLGNALSFSPPGGTVAVSARAAGGQAVIAVDDEGPGVPPERREAIFERFYSDRAGDAAKGGHSGLGLAIARQIVEAHGGQIRAGDRPDRRTGARFTVSLPLAA